MRARCARRAGAAAVLVALALSGCGGAGPAPASHASSKVVKPPRGAGVSAAAATVIEGWTTALRTGHPKRAAAYWAHPSVMINGAGAAGEVAVLRIDNSRQARIADETLSCGATLTATSREGRYVLAEFTLSVRKGTGASSSGCSGPAAVDFLIRKRHIVRWLRAPTAAEKAPSGHKATGGAVS